MTIDAQTVMSASTESTTRLITQSDDRERLTANRETDVRTALTRGLKEYLERLSIDWPGGRQSRFKRVEQTWATPEESAEYPSASVYSEQPGVYEASSLTPETIDLGDNLTIRKVAEFRQPLTVEFITMDPIERMALVAMLEDAFDPVDWMTGFRLELPHYFNTRAEFEKTGMDYVDGPVQAHRRMRAVHFQLVGGCSQYRFVGLVPKPQFRLDCGEADGGRGAIGPNVVLD